MKKIKSLYGRISNFIKRYGVAAAIKKTFQKLFPGKRSANRRRQKDAGYIPENSPNLNAALYQKFPGMKALLVLAMPERVQTINLVVESINAENLSGMGAAPLIFAVLLSGKYNLPLRIITRQKPAQKKYFAQALMNAGINYDQEVEFIHCDPTARPDAVLTSEEDLFITTSWWTTRSVMDSYAKEKTIYFVQEDERKHCSAGDELENCSGVLADTEVNFVINAKELFTHFVYEGFENIKDNAQWVELSSANRDDSTAKLFFWLEKRDTIKCIK